MGYKKIISLLLITAHVGCVAGKPSDHNVQFGGAATSLDLSYINENWNAIRSRIVEFDGRNCVARGLSLENLEFISIESLERLSLSATDFQHNIDPKEVKKIFGLEFSDPCGKDVSPAWIVVETNTGFSVIDFILIEE